MATKKMIEYIAFVRKALDVICEYAENEEEGLQYSIDARFNSPSAHVSCWIRDTKSDSFEVATSTSITGLKTSLDVSRQKVLEDREAYKKRRKQQLLKELKELKEYD